MLDVHPPHTPTHTLRDFFIHIGTIVVGLLIAIGLEQTVEYFHRQHERHSLEHELHAEAELMQRNAEIDIGQYDSQLKYLVGLRKDVSLRMTNYGVANPPIRQYVEPPMGHGILSSGTIAIVNPIWDSARSDGRLALLPEGLKRAYGVVAYRKQEWDQRGLDNLSAVEALRSVTLQCASHHSPRTPDFSCLTPAQLVEVRVAATAAFEKLRVLRFVAVALAGELNLVLGPEPLDQQSLTPADGKYLAEARTAHPEDYARMADEIDAEDSARDRQTSKPQP